ncbi:MAG: YjhG/YagF family D-xylonate dehydratase [Verrucomicrobiota bacterium]
MKIWWDCSESLKAVRTKMPHRTEAFDLSEEMLRHSPSGDLFGLAQDVGMGWSGGSVAQRQVLILTTMGGLRREDGTVEALGYHTGHWELGLMAKEAAATLREHHLMPFAAHCSDPCDGRTQGTAGMMDSLPYRNSAAEVMGRLIRSLPRRRGVMGMASCDKGLPAVMMALAENADRPGILVPGGVSLPPDVGEDAGTVQSIGARFTHGELTLKEAAALGCAACASPGGGCQFLGTAATTQALGEALGMSLTHSALAPSGERIWLDLARASAEQLIELMDSGVTLKDILSEDALHNAMVVHSAIGGSSNLLLHLPAVVYQAGVRRPGVEDWSAINRKTPRLVDVLPNGPKNHVTVQFFLAGGVPEVMLKLRDLDLLKLDCMTVSGRTLGDNLEAWESSFRRAAARQRLRDADGVEPDEVIMTPEEATRRGLKRTLIFPAGNLAPEGSVVKSTAIADDLFVDGVYRKVGRARVFTTEKAAIAAVKSSGGDRLRDDEIIVLVCQGPMGAGFPETAQITISLKYTQTLKHVALITDGRFSGFSSGPCIGHIGPEAMAGGPVGKVRDGDVIDLVLDAEAQTGSIELIGEAETPETERSPSMGSSILERREAREDLHADAHLPRSVKLWAALQQTGGGTWGGCVPDIDKISEALTSCS